MREFLKVVGKTNCLMSCVCGTYFEIIQFRTVTSMRDMGIMEGAQQRAMMEKRPQPMKRGWESWDCSAWGRESSEISSVCTYTEEEGAARTEPDTFQWCLVWGQEPMGTKWNMGGNIWTPGTTFYCASGSVFAQVAQRGGWISILDSIEKLFAQGTGWCCSKWPCLSRDLDRMEEISSNLRHSMILWVYC